MSANLIASRYAKSLLELCEEQSKLKEVNEDLVGLKDALKNRDLFAMLKSPIIKADKKNSILKAIFDGKVDSVTSSFMDLVVRRGRENILPEIVDSFIEQFKSKNSVSAVKIISAAPLEEAVMERINKELASSSHTANKIELNVEVDPSLIGGFILQIGDKLYDASVVHQLGKLRKELSQN